MSSPTIPLSSTDFPAPAAPSDHLLPESEDRTRLESAAQSVGNTLGRAVNKVREIPRRFTVIRGGANDTVSQLSDTASSKLDDLKDQARDLKAQARNRAELLNARMRHYIHEYPLQCLGGIFGAAFLAGITLRIWRTRD